MENNGSRLLDSEEFSEVLKQVKQQAIEKIRQSEVRNETLLYAVPYKEMPISVPKKSNEVPLILKDVIVVVKEMLIDRYGNTNRIDEMYDKNANLIGATDGNHKMELKREDLEKLDKEIFDDLIKQQIKAIEDAGMEVAGNDSLSSQGKIETYFEMVGRRLVILNEEQEQAFERSREHGEGEQYLQDESRKNITPTEDEKALKNVEQEQARARLEQDLNVEISKATLIDDDLFFQNNPDIKSSYAYAVLTKTGEIQIVAEQDGKYRPVDGFKEATAEAGRADIIRNDEAEIETKNTYGAIESTKNADYRYALELGQYGEIKLLEQRRYHGATIEESDKWLTREVQTENTNFLDRNLEGNKRENIARNTFDAQSNNKDANSLGNSDNSGGISDKTKKINEHMTAHGDGDLTFEQLAASVEQRVNDALPKIENKLKEKGVEISDEEETEIKNDVQEKIEKNNVVFCDEVIEEYCDNFIEEKAKKEPEEDKDNKSLGREILDEAEGMLLGKAERTLEGDALERRRSNGF